MKNIYLVISTLAILLLQGCTLKQASLPVNNQMQSCLQKCKSEGLLKRGYQKVQNIERCQMRC